MAYDEYDSERTTAMLARYTMERGKPASELPQGSRQDTRKHTRHCLRPAAELVARFLDAPGDGAWSQFEAEYAAALEQRFTDDPSPFDRLAELASREDVYLGCSCPTKKNPDVWHCHTVLALGFMRRKYPELEVVMPEPVRR